MTRLLRPLHGSPSGDAKSAVQPDYDELDPFVRLAPAIHSSGDSSGAPSAEGERAGSPPHTGCRGVPVPAPLSPPRVTFIAVPPGSAEALTIEQRNQKVREIRQLLVGGILVLLVLLALILFGHQDPSPPIEFGAPALKVTLSGGVVAADGSSGFGMLVPGDTFPPLIWTVTARGRSMCYAATALVTDTSNDSNDLPAGSASSGVADSSPAPRVSALAHQIIVRVTLDDPSGRLLYEGPLDEAAVGDPCSVFAPAGSEQLTLATDESQVIVMTGGLPITATASNESFSWSWKWISSALR